MRTLIISGRNIDIRPMTRKEIRKLKEFGFGPAVYIPTVETINEAWDEAFDIVLKKEDLEFLDECPNADSRKVWQGILAEIYGDKEEEKNLQSTGNGTTIKKE